MRVRHWSWVLLALATLAAAVLPDLVSLPEPDGALLLDRAMLLQDRGPPQQVTLPHAVFSGFGQAIEPTRYAVEFAAPPEQDGELFLFIPSVNRRVALALNGRPFMGFDAADFWTGPLVGAPVMVRLPQTSMMAGRNRLTVTLDTDRFAAPTYLSQIYLGSEAGLARAYRWRDFFGSRAKTLALAGQFLFTIGLMLTYFLRPKDPLFAWLAALTVVSLIVAVGISAGYQPDFQRMLPVYSTLLPSMGFIFVGLMLRIVDRVPPRSLTYAAVLSPVVLLPCLVLDTASALKIIGAVSIPLLIACYLVSAGILSWAALRRNDLDARLILAPVALIAWYSVRDTFVVATAPAHGYNLLVSYGRPLLLAFVTAMLMRRMAVSLDAQDRANETLQQKLAEREAELHELHRQERERTARLALEEERERLTRDLHDGLSGHLASIIALAERSGETATERAARNALNDLRLVIHSLDLDDRELPLALASFRERVLNQLEGLGIDLDWSIASLPEVSGVRPGNALAILRILQEAITNAVKYGPATRIKIRGAAAGDGMLALTVENDGGPFAEREGGFGLINMRRRANQLGGDMRVETVDEGVRVTLTLPVCLPDL
jgi:signal transduction histidine kinase